MLDGDCPTTMQSGTSCQPQCSGNLVISKEATCISGKLSMPQCLASDSSAIRTCLDTEYETVAPNNTNDRQCITIRTCNNTEYETVAPTTTRDRQCNQCTKCNNTEYEIQTCTSNQNRQCTSNQNLCTCTKLRQLYIDSCYGCVSNQVVYGNHSSVNCIFSIRDRVNGENIATCGSIKDLFNSQQNCCD